MNTNQLVASLRNHQQSALLGLWLMTDGPARAEALDEFHVNVDGYIYSVAIQSDGKILLGGDFTELQGFPRNLIGRLHADGSLDATFDPAATGIGPAVSGLSLQADGKIFIHSSMGTNLVRLYPDGGRDLAFHPALAGLGHYLSCFALQADQKILVVMNGSTNSQGSLFRLNSDGTLDSTFNSQFRGSLKSLIVQTDGKILANTGGITPNLIRLNSDGTLDPTFNSQVWGGINTMIQQADSKIVIQGSFLNPWASLLRLNADGGLDTNYQSTVNAILVRCLAAQADGQLLAGNGAGVMSLHPNGGLNTSFSWSTNDLVEILGVQPDGKVLGIAYDNGQKRSYVRRFANPNPAVQSLT
jgi:uncharacterized delta-60 repeat protein